MRLIALLIAFVSFSLFGAESQAAGTVIPVLTVNPATPYAARAAGACTITQVGGAFTVSGGAGKRYEVPAPATYRVACQVSLTDLRETLIEEAEIAVADGAEITVPLFYDTAVITAHVVQLVGGISSYPDLAVTVRRDDGFTTTIRSGSNPFRGPRNVFAAGHTYTLTVTLSGVTLTRTIVAVAGTRRQAGFRFRM